MATPSPISHKEDRFGGVIADVSGTDEFEQILSAKLQEWSAAGKRGIWMKVANQFAATIPVLISNGFDWHHAKPGYCLLNRWLPQEENKLPRYPFTQIGVGGFVLNSLDEVLMVQEKVAAVKAAEGQWKLPGGLADPGEDLDQTAAREVREECGVDCKFESVATMRHAHGYANGTDDLYFVLRMRATSEDIKTDATEIAQAAWISRARIEELAAQGLVNSSNKKTLDLCYDGVAITAESVPSVRGGFTKLYFGKVDNSVEDIFGLFQAYDINGTGLINETDLKAVLSKIGVPDAHIDSLLRPQRSPSGKVAYKEFLGDILRPGCFAPAEKQQGKMANTGVGDHILGA